MKRDKVKSSNIHSIGYDKVSRTLEVEFNSGGVYYYNEVPLKVYLRLINSSSLGKAFFRLIKSSYKYKKGEYTVKNNEIPNIYICGKAGSGKTFSANYLIRKMGYIQAKFAYPVYDIARNYFGMIKKDRLLLQTIGTDCAREAVNKDIWVNRFIEDTMISKLTREKLGLNKAGLICDDCRFPNENKVLSDNGWIGIFLNVSDEIRVSRLNGRDGNAQVTTLSHSSELGVDEFKNELIQVDASGTLEEMYANLDKVLKEKIHV